MRGDSPFRAALVALMAGLFGWIVGLVFPLISPEYAATVSALAAIGAEVAHRLAERGMASPSLRLTEVGAAFLIAKIVLPETEVADTAGRIPFRVERTADGVIEAAANGTQDGIKLALNIAGMLIAFMALVNLVNWPLGTLGESSIRAWSSSALKRMARLVSEHSTPISTAASKPAW